MKLNLRKLKVLKNKKVKNKVMILLYLIIICPLCLVCCNRQLTNELAGEDYKYWDLIMVRDPLKGKNISMEGLKRATRFDTNGDFREYYYKNNTRIQIPYSDQIPLNRWCFSDKTTIIINDYDTLKIRVLTIDSLETISINSGIIYTYKKSASQNKNDSVPPPKNMLHW